MVSVPGRPPETAISALPGRDTPGALSLGPGAR
jgi:hypothetical protein